jgi:hypothetical protein
MARPPDTPGQAACAMPILIAHLGNLWNMAHTQHFNHEPQTACNT